MAYLVIMPWLSCYTMIFKIATFILMSLKITVFRVLTFCLLLGMGIQVGAQTTFQPKQIEFDWKGIVYRYEKAFDFSLHTHGFILGYNVGRIKTYDKTSFYHFSLGYMRDMREKRQNKNIPFDGMTSSPFVYGKLNSLYILRFGWGKKKYLSEKAKRKGIAVGYSYEIGPAVGMLKPNYLELLFTEEVNGQLIDDLRAEPYTDDNADVFLDYNRIFGGGGFSRGWNELTFTPGLQARGGVLFSLGAYDKYVKALEVGVMADVFIKKMPILIETEAVSNKPYFINLYLTLQLGYRSN